MKFGLLTVNAKINLLKKFGQVLMNRNCLLNFYASYGLIEYNQKSIYKSFK
jgi:hypothetical protein